MKSRTQYGGSLPTARDTRGSSRAFVLAIDERVSKTQDANFPGIRNSRADPDGGFLEKARRVSGCPCGGPHRVRAASRSRRVRI